MANLKHTRKMRTSKAGKVEIPARNNHLRVVSYLRMSTDKQEDSPERQREQIEAYARKQGYSIREAYCDSGIPGDDLSRPEFVRMMADARARKFDVILIDEPSRLSRTTPLRFIAEVVYPLEETNISVESVSTGRMCWGDLAGLIMTIVHADASRTEVRNLSRRVLDGLARSIRAANWNYRPPFGFTVKEERDPAHPKKLRSRRLVPGDPKQVAAVRWMFAAYAKGRCGLREIALELASRGAFSKNYNGKQRRYPVTVSAISAMLHNPIYVGDLAWNRRSYGKYCRLVDGRAEFQPRRGRNPESEWIIISNTHQGLVRRSIFQAVKERFGSTPRKLPVDRPREPYKLAKLLVCGRCNGRMYAWTQKQNSGWIKKYSCLASKICGTGHCHNNSVNEKVIVEAVTDTIQKALARRDEFSKALLMKLAGALVILDQGTASQVRATLGELFERIALNFKYSFHLKATRSILCGGDIFLKRPAMPDMISPEKLSFIVP
jgi:DNA invertase Pin-like site-specific DNA recombinase